MLNAFQVVLLNKAGAVPAEPSLADKYNLTKENEKFLMPQASDYIRKRIDIYQSGRLNCEKISPRKLHLLRGCLSIDMRFGETVIIQMASRIFSLSCGCMKYTVINHDDQPGFYLPSFLTFTV